MSSDFCNPNHRKLDMPDSSSSNEDEQGDEENNILANNQNKTDPSFSRNEELKLCENFNKI